MTLLPSGRGNDAAYRRLNCSTTGRETRQDRSSCSTEHLDDPSLCVCLGLEAYHSLSDAIASDDLDVEAGWVTPHGYCLACHLTI